MTKYEIQYDGRFIRLIKEGNYIGEVHIRIVSEWRSAQDDSIIEMSTEVSFKNTKGEDSAAIIAFLREANLVMYSEYEQYLNLQVSALNQHLELSRKVYPLDKQITEVNRLLTLVE